MMKKTIALVLAVLTMLLMLGFAAFAEEESTGPSLPALDLWVGGRSVVLRVMNLPDDATISSVKSSKAARLKATLDDGIITLQPLKAGKSKITVKYKAGGKSASVSANYTVYKYPKPLSTLTINGQSVNLSKYKFFYEFNNYEQLKTNITFKPSSGWTVVSAIAELSDPASITKRVKVTSGTSFVIPEGKDAVVRISLENKKGQKLTYIVNFSR